LQRSHGESNQQTSGGRAPCEQPGERQPTRCAAADQRLRYPRR
jgi:hypothetical protein